jgi:hypothetical protein
MSPVIERQDGHERHLPVLDGPDAQAVAERRPADRREREGALGAQTRKAAAIRH